MKHEFVGACRGVQEDEATDLLGTYRRYIARVGDAVVCVPEPLLVGKRYKVTVEAVEGE